MCQNLFDSTATDSSNTEDLLATKNSSLYATNGVAVGALAEVDLLAAVLGFADGRSNHLYVYIYNRCLE